MRPDPKSIQVATTENKLRKPDRKTSPDRDSEPAADHVAKTVEGWLNSRELQPPK